VRFGALERSVAVLAAGAITLLTAPSVGSAMMHQGTNGGGEKPPAVVVKDKPTKARPTKDKPEPSDDIDEPKPSLGKRIVDIASQQAGDPYVYGAAGPDRFDCSGLTQYVHARLGIDLPRTARQQRAALPYVPKAEMRPGDLLFFHENGSVYHVGIYAGKGKMWAAPEPGDVVRLQDIWTQSFTVGRAW
jgi:cell wall-associated NlpC family hydrolase